MKSINKKLMIVICFIILTLSVVLVACNNGEEEDPDNNDNNLTPLPTNCVGDYEMNIDFRNTPEASYYFKPKHSGVYTFTYDYDNMTATIDGQEVKSGYTAYYNKVNRYQINYKGSGYFAKCFMRPTVLNEEPIEILPSNDCIVRFYPDEARFYTINTDAGNYKVLDSSYNEVKGDGHNVFYLNTKNLSNNGLYYIVLINTANATAVVTCAIDKLVMETITLDKSQAEMDLMPISGNTGEKKYYLLDVKSNDMFIFNVYGLSGNSALTTNIYNLDNLMQVKSVSLVVGASHFYYEYSLEIGVYYLILEFNDSINVNISFN